MVALQKSLRACQINLRYHSILAISSFPRSPLGSPPRQAGALGMLHLPTKPGHLCPLPWLGVEWRWRPYTECDFQSQISPRRSGSSGGSKSHTLLTTCSPPRLAQQVPRAQTPDLAQHPLVALHWPPPQETTLASTPSTDESWGPTCLPRRGYGVYPSSPILRKARLRLKGQKSYPGWCHQRQDTQEMFSSLLKRNTERT